MDREEASLLGNAVLAGSPHLVRESGRSDSKTIERYGPGGFLISGVTYTGSVIVLPDALHDWEVIAAADITLAALAPVIEHGAIEILLVGTGRTMRPLPLPLRAGFRKLGIALDVADTSAACRTFAVLAAERRRVAAALIPARF